MGSNESNTTSNGTETVSTVTDRRARANRPQPRQRFKIVSFTNRGGSESWRVAGIKRTGERIRENFTDAAAARCRQAELETEYLARTVESTALRATRLSETQTRLAETVFPMLDHDEDILTAVQFWRQNRHLHVAVESPRLDDAFAQFKAWLKTTGSLRDDSKTGLRIRLNTFVNSVPNTMLSAITPEFIESYLAKSRSEMSGITRDNDRRAISRFLSWCKERPRRWISTNPAHEVKIDRGETPPPVILSINDCEKLLHSAENHEAGLLVPYTAVCLIAGLRPDEAKRLTWKQVNLTDKEIRMEANQTKTKTPRVVKIQPSLAAWLKEYKGKPFYPPNWRREFDAVKQAAGFTGRQDPATKGAGKPFPHDVMRHTAISHFFRDRQLRLDR